MLIQLIIGSIFALTGVLLFNYARSHDLYLSWWRWGLTILGLGYGVFVLEVIVGFLQEGAPQAALVMGMVTGVIAVIWGVLLRRFVFVKPKNS